MRNQGRLGRNGVHWISSKIIRTTFEKRLTSRALGTIALAGLGATLASAGGDKAAPQTTPAPVESIKADSAEETDLWANSPFSQESQLTWQHPTIRCRGGEGGEGSLDVWAGWRTEQARSIMHSIRKPLERTKSRAAWHRAFETPENHTRPSPTSSSISLGLLLVRRLAASWVPGHEAPNGSLHVRQLLLLVFLDHSGCQRGLLSIEIATDRVNSSALSA